jgi:bifunctional non-homologous end joining protein LigD
MDHAEIEVGDRKVQLTNLQKVFWPKLGLTKRDLLQYYADISPVLLPHLKGRAMVMKRYPNGAEGEFFFMKHAPPHRPKWISICSILHGSGNLVDFPVIDDVAELLWVVNLGCIDLNQWYAPCDDVDRPDYVHFDLDPTPEGTFEQALETSLIACDALRSLGMTPYVKTTGSRGLHVYVPIVRGPTQKEVWTFAKTFAQLMAKQKPDLITAEYKIAKRPPGHILVDYNQNAWGRTLASIYSVRPRPLATVSTPVTWEEIVHGIQTEDFRIDNVPDRVRKLGDLWQPLLSDKGRFDLGRLRK